MSHTPSEAVTSARMVLVMSVPTVMVLAGAMAWAMSCVAGVGGLDTPASFDSTIGPGASANRTVPPVLLTLLMVGGAA